MEEAKLERLNDLGQPIGFAVPGWKPVGRPPSTPMPGRVCDVVRLGENHAQDLFEAFSADRENRIWTYLPYGPFDSAASLGNWLEATCLGEDPLFHAVIDKETGRALGVASYLRIEPATGVIEVGHINFSPALQKTVMASEAMFLMMARVFDELGYRRYEWKCDALNAPSMAAARRLGFVYEGTFRQATLYKGRNRDTAWFSVTDREWPGLKAAFEAWLAPDNFDDDGRQRRSLAEIRTKS
ncbi:GNAT family N-acetyltransferase [Stappia sp. GBMRC 2046]|uniref:GNAT family N-acetyltransferase n=1 Tax=Stappia sediminis TaxID=2692190 RepID=A0A7X3S5P4_9HYPH|nr:GNAT family protein [Stappia sediminis]MXN63375.1 GNAT family N-acetyltransferase [Stappia sediminis]